MRTRRGAPAKRAFDVLCALTLLVLLSPVLALAALAVKCGSVGPVLFRQVRVGRGGRTFQILKLRTMCVDAERRGLSLSVAARDERLTMRAVSCGSRASTSCRNWSTFSEVT